jgi:hypothetical protein
VVVDVVCTAGGVLAGGAVADGAVAGGGGASAEASAGAAEGTVAISVGRGKEIALITYRGIPLAVIGARLALAGSRKETNTGGVRAENAPCVDVHEMVGVLQMEEEGGSCLVCLTRRFKLRWEAVGRWRCLSQKGLGAEAVCIECSLTLRLAFYLVLRRFSIQ